MSQGSSRVKMAGAEGTSSKGRKVPIPVDLYNECKARARAQEAEVKPSKFEIQICPYRKGHRVSMSAHLAKCRLKYATRMMAKGYKWPRVTCKYNVRHQVLAPEKQFHEDRCEDRHYIPFYLLYVNPYFEDGRKKLRANLEECKIIDPVELAKMHEGLFLDTIIGSGNRTLKPVPVDDILYPEAAKERKLLEEKEEEEAKVKQSQADSGAEDKQKEGAVGGDVEMDEEEKWWNECTGPKFNYLQSAYNAKGPLCIKRHPSGLSKQGRREFDKWNTQWMAKILAEDRVLHPENYPADDDDLAFLFYETLYFDADSRPRIPGPPYAEVVSAPDPDLATAPATDISNASRSTSEETVAVPRTRGRRRLQKWVPK